MAHVYADRVREQSATVGMGTLALAGAVAGHQTFLNGVGNANTTYYSILDDTTSEWEVGLGTVGVGTLSRDAVLASSNANALVNLQPGTKTVDAVAASAFFTGALTNALHNATDHTGIMGVLSVEDFDTADHDGTDHTNAPWNLLDSPTHDGIDHTAPPFSLVSQAAHDLALHTGLGLYDAVAHDAVDHTAGPFNLLDQTAHDALDHSNVPGITRTTIHQSNPAHVLGGGGPVPYNLLIPAGTLTVDGDELRITYVLEIPGGGSHVHNVSFGGAGLIYAVTIVGSTVLMEVTMRFVRTAAGTSIFYGRDSGEVGTGTTPTGLVPRGTHNIALATAWGGPLTYSMNSGSFTTVILRAIRAEKFEQVP